MVKDLWYGVLPSKLVEHEENTNADDCFIEQLSDVFIFGSSPVFSEKTDLLIQDPSLAREGQ